MAELIDSLNLDQLLKMIKLVVVIQLIGLKKTNTAEDVHSIELKLDDDSSYVRMHITFKYNSSAIWAKTDSKKTTIIAKCINKIFDCNIMTALSGDHTIHQKSAMMVFHPGDGFGSNGLHKSKKPIIFAERNPNQEGIGK